MYFIIILKELRKYKILSQMRSTAHRRGGSDLAIVISWFPGFRKTPGYLLSRVKPVRYLRLSYAGRRPLSSLHVLPCMMVVVG